MKKTLLFLRHAGSGKNAILDAVACLGATLKKYEGRPVKVLASNCDTAAPTVIALQELLKVDPLRIPLLKKAKPQDHDFDAVIQLAAKQDEQIILFVTHAEYSAKLPLAFARHYNLGSQPSGAELKSGHHCAMRLPGKKIKAVQDELLLATLEN